LGQIPQTIYEINKKRKNKHTKKLIYERTRKHKN
jgi:hypothetical protein